MGPPQPTRKVRAREGEQQRPRPSVPALPVRRPKPSVAWAFTGTIPAAAHSVLRLRTGQAFLRCRGPASLESPGRAVRGTPVYRAKGPLDPLQCSGSPMARAFAGTIPALRTPCCAWAPAQAFLRCRCPCYARKPGACRPWHARSPGKGSPGPFAMPRFTRGLGVRRDQRPPDARLVPAHPPDCCLSPAHPPDTRLIPAHPLAPRQVCGAPRAGPFGRENCHGHLSFRGLTPAGDGLGNKCSSCFHRGRLEKHC